MSSTSRKIIESSLVLFAFLFTACNQAPEVIPSTAAGSRPVIFDGGHLKARDFGTSVDDFGYGLAANATGVYAVGSTFGSLDGPNKGSRDAFVRKYDGGVVWAQQFGTRAYDRAVAVAVDATGNSYVAGTTDGALGFKIGNDDGYLRKYSSTGAVIWTRQFGTAGTDLADDVALDGSGNVFVLSRDNFNGFTVRKFSSAGVLLASRNVINISLPSLEPKALAIDSAGNVIVLTEWDGGATSGSNVRVFKLTNALADIWNVPYQTNFYDFGYDIATFGTDIYITAQIDTSTAGFGARYAKLNAAGAIILTRQLEPTPTCGCTVPRSIAVDGSGFVYVTGNTSGAFTGFTNAGSADIVAFKYDAAGTRVWVRQLGAGTYGSALNDAAFGVAVSDAVYVTGFTDGNLLGDPKYGASDTDAFLAQLDKTTGAILGIDQ
jgi:hypothetical protein